MDEERRARHSADIYRINGKPVSFRILTPDEIDTKPDLVIFATKYNGLRSAREMTRPLVGQNTTIVSLLNGISSEEILSETFPAEQIIDTVAIGMDAIRDGTSLNYQNSGKWQIGMRDAGQSERLQILQQFLEETGIPYEVCDDIRRAMWNKFMINVGINQTCMVYNTNYGGVVNEAEPFDAMTKAMHEVIDIAAAEGISLTEEDYRKDIEILKGLNPDGYPSMQQDAMAKRKSEVEIFSGTVIRIAQKHGIKVPVNERYYRRIQEIEEGCCESQGRCEPEGRCESEGRSF